MLMYWKVRLLLYKTRFFFLSATILAQCHCYRCWCIGRWDCWFIRLSFFSVCNNSCAMLLLSMLMYWKVRLLIYKTQFFFLSAIILPYQICKVRGSSTAIRPAIHSDFIWIIQIFYLKFSEIQITWLNFRFFWLEFVRDFFIRGQFRLSNSDSFLYIQIFPSHSFRFCVRSKWQVCVSHATDSMRQQNGTWYHPYGESIAVLRKTRRTNATLKTWCNGIL